MSDIPLPKKPLGQHCSVLVNGTLYTFAENAFQSLRLKGGEKWKELPLLFGTQGAACVHAHQGTPDEALYILGGMSPNTTMIPERGYMGMQKYTFMTAEWENIKLKDAVAYNIINHEAIYLKDTGEILMFSGTRYPGEEAPSAMTFRISTTAPYNITSIAGNTPFLKPVMLPWENDGALILGGGIGYTNLITYSLSHGWGDLGIHLKEGIPARKAAAAIVDGDDGSRMLLTFDTSVSPVKFSQTKIYNATSPGYKGDLVEANWPAYDNTFAPTGWNTSFSVATDGDQLVFSKGNDQEPLSIFELRKNHWRDTSALFSQKEGSEVESNGTSGSKTQDSTSSLPLSESPTPTPTPTETGKAAVNNIQLLFITLGATLGALLILGSALFYLRQRKLKRKRIPLKRSNTARSAMSFQDRGLSFMKEAGGMEDDLLPQQEQQRGSGWSKYFSGNSATNLVKLPSRTYSTGTRVSLVYDNNNWATRYPYTNETASKTSVSIHSAGLELDLPGAALNVDPQAFSASRRVSNVSLSSFGASSYSSGIPESFIEKSTWDPTGDNDGSIGMVSTVSTSGRYGQVQNSPRGWGIVTTDNRVASSVFPESAVTVYPDEYLRPSNSRAKASRNPNTGAGDIKGDVSWLNLGS